MNYYVLNWLSYGKTTRRQIMEDSKSADMKKEELEQVVELGSDITKSS